MEKTSAQFLAQKRQQAAAGASFIKNEMQTGQDSIQISDLRQTRSDGLNAKSVALQEEARKLASAIGEWKQTYLIIAPIAGRVSLAKIWSPQQTVAAGDEVLTVVPASGASRAICKATLPVAQSSKVRVGQRVNVSLDGFPRQQFGVLKGRVANISLTPQKEDYLVDVELPQGVRTSYGKTLELKQESPGAAVIITEDRRAVSRVFDQVNDVLKNRE